MAGLQVGYQTWYPNADPSYIQRCQIKDEQTTQATFGFKVCGMQVGCSLSSSKGSALFSMHAALGQSLLHTGPQAFLALPVRGPINSLFTSEPVDAVVGDSSIITKG